MKFQVLDIIPHLKNPITGEIVSTADRLSQVVETARRAEDLTWSGRFRAPMTEPTTTPRPFDGPPRRPGRGSHHPLETEDPYGSRPESVHATRSTLAYLH